METPPWLPCPPVQIAPPASSRGRGGGESSRYPRSTPAPPPSPPYSIPPRHVASQPLGKHRADAIPPLPIYAPVPHGSRSALGQAPFPLCSWKSLRSHFPLPRTYSDPGPASVRAPHSPRFAAATLKTAPAPQIASGFETPGHTRPALRLPLPHHF